MSDVESKTLRKLQDQNTILVRYNGLSTLKAYHHLENTKYQADVAFLSTIATASFTGFFRYVDDNNSALRGR